MSAGRLKTAWLAAAAASGGITAAIVLYTVLVEVLASRGYRGPLAQLGAGPFKYAFYALGAMALPAIKLAGRKLAAKLPTAEDTIRALTAAAIIRAAAAELPAIAGLLLFLLAGLRADFYMLAVFAIGLELYHFPRLGAWEEKLRGDFGQYEP